MAMKIYIRPAKVGIPALWLLGILAGALIASACGSAQATSAAVSAPTAAPAPMSAAVSGSTSASAEVEQPLAQLSGTIEIDGSSTVFPISEAVAEEFGKVAPDVHVNVGVSGSGGGFKRFTAGETDISDASRPISDEEAAAAAENGIGYLEFLVGLDGLSVMVSPQNDFVECMTVEQLEALWQPGSSVDSWNDLDPSWPERGINLYGPGTDSGTFDYFTEEIVGEMQASRADYTASEDDNVLVQGVSGDRNALGYFGYAYYAENADKLKLVGVDAGDGCVKPTIDAIASGEYKPLSRPLFIYVNEERVQRRAELRSFVEFYMENGAALTREVGYVPLSAEAYADNAAQLK